MQADPKHKEDNSQLGQLSYSLKVSDESGSERPDGNPGEQVADNRRQSDSPGQHSSKECDGKGYGYVYEEWQFVHILSALTGIILSSDTLFNHARHP
jgi:hypothetical protein